MLCLAFSEALGTAPHSTPADELVKPRLGKLLLAWAETWLASRAQRAEITRAKSSWRLGTSSLPQGSIMGSTTL